MDTENCNAVISKLLSKQRDLLNHLPSLPELLKTGIPLKEICEALNSVQSEQKITPYKLKKFCKEHGIELSQMTTYKKSTVKNAESEHKETCKEEGDLSSSGQNIPGSNLSTNKDQKQEFPGIVDPSLYVSNVEP